MRIKGDVGKKSNEGTHRDVKGIDSMKCKALHICMCREYIKEKIEGRKHCHTRMMYRADVRE